MPFEIEVVHDLEAVWPELVTMFIELDEYHGPWLARRRRQDWEVRWRDYVRLGEDRQILIARNQSDAIGYVSAGIRRDYGPFEEVVGFIEDAYVRPAHRSQGVGRAMLEAAETWCRQRGAGEVRLNVVVGNELGLGFWKSRGFEPMTLTMRKPLAAAS